MEEINKNILKDKATDLALYRGLLHAIESGHTKPHDVLLSMKTELRNASLKIVFAPGGDLVYANHDMDFDVNAPRKQLMGKRIKFGYDNLVPYR
jgi:hypothetical protein